MDGDTLSMLTTPRDAIGTIVPSKALPDGFFEATRAGEYLQQVELTGEVPMICKDGRPTVDGPLNGVSVPGGSLALVIVSAYLLNEAGEDVDFFEVIEQVADSSRDMDFPLGVHRDDSSDQSGCGAADGLATVLAETDRHGESIRRLADALGVKSLGQKITIGTRLPTGPQIIEKFEELGVPAYVLAGSHNEQAVIHNLMPDTVIDREKIAREYGEDFYTFCVDIWAFPHIAEVVLDVVAHLAPHINWEGWIWKKCGIECNAFDEIQAALVTLSLAVSMTLCGPGLPVIAVTPKSVEGEE